MNHQINLRLAARIASRFPDKLFVGGVILGRAAITLRSFLAAGGEFTQPLIDNLALHSTVNYLFTHSLTNLLREAAIDLEGPLFVGTGVLSEEAATIDRMVATYRSWGNDFMTMRHFF